MTQVKGSTELAKDYYDSPSADAFYHEIWGGEDIHIGIYESDTEPIRDASSRTVKKMASMLPGVNQSTKILDIGAGYGGAARQLARLLGCQITCFNLSAVENNRNEEKNKEQGLDNLIDVHTGNFEHITFDEGTFDVVWCEDSILHSDHKAKVFKEVGRVLKKGGHFIFHDPMQSDDCPEGVLQPIFDRIHLTEMGSVKWYKELAADAGMEEVEILEMPEQMRNHYSRVLQELNKNEENLLQKGCDQEYIKSMRKGLQHWIDGVNNGYLNWGILKFEKI